MNTSQPEAIHASLNYLGEMHERPMFHVFDYSRNNLNLVPHTALVRDGRRALEGATLEKEGFCLVQHRTSVVRLDSKREIHRTYSPEIEELIGLLTGARWVAAEPVGVVRMSQWNVSQPAVHPPLRFVHTDFTPESAAWLIHRLFHTAGEDFLGSGRRCVVYNIWRCLTPAPQDMPLAICDSRTTDPRDAVAVDAVLDFPGSRPGMTQTSLFRFNECNEWYYYPNMTRDEVLVFKSFDSHAADVGWVPHCAFDHPACRSASTGRVSLDLRAVAIFQ